MTNADLYELLFQHVHTNNITLTTRWIPSHLDTEPEKARPDWVMQHHISGNAQADRLADIAATAATISDMNITRRVIDHTYLTKRIQARLATIVCNLPNRSKHIKYKVPKEVATSRQTLISLSHHSLVQRGDIIFCTVCKGRINFNSPNLRSFLDKVCDIVSQVHVGRYAQDKPVRINTTVQIANSVTHPSHKLMSYRGVIFCNACGCAAQTVLRGLAKSCKRSRNGHGQRVQERIAQGLLPHGMNTWPDDCSNVPWHEVIISTPGGVIQ